MILDRPVHAPEAADGTTASAVAAPVASGFAVYGGLAQTFNPPPPDFRPSQAGWRVMITSQAALASSLLIIPWAVQARSHRPHSWRPHFPEVRRLRPERHVDFRCCTGERDAHDASTSGITDEDGMTNAAYSYRWLGGSPKSAALPAPPTPWLPASRYRPSRCG